MPVALFAYEAPVHPFAVAKATSLSTVMCAGQVTQVKVAVQGALTHPLASVILAVRVQVPIAVQAMVLTTVPLCPVRCAVSQPLKSTVNGPVPPLIVMVKFCELPTQIVAVAG